MRSQQEAERAEQQRIKSLVLNYDLTDDHDGEEPAFLFVRSNSSKRQVLVGTGNLNNSLKQRSASGHTQRSTSSSDEAMSGDSAMLAQENTSNARHDSFADETGGLDHPHGQPRQDKSGNSRSKQRARKLQLGDIDWYGTRTPSIIELQEPSAVACIESHSSKRDDNARQNGRHARGSMRGRRVMR